MHDEDGWGGSREARVSVGMRCELLAPFSEGGLQRAAGPAELLLPVPFPSAAGREGDGQGHLLGTS